MAKIELKRIENKNKARSSIEPQIVIPDEILTEEELNQNKLDRLKLIKQDKWQKQDILKLLDSGVNLLTSVISCYKDITMQKEKTKIERLNAKAKVAEAKEKTKQIITQETELTKREIRKFEELEKVQLIELEKYRTELMQKKVNDAEERRILANVLNTLLKNFDSLLSEKALIIKKINEDDIAFERYKIRLNEIDTAITESQHDIIQLITTNRRGDN